MHVRDIYIPETHYDIKVYFIYTHHFLKLYLEDPKFSAHEIKNGFEC